MFVLQQLITLTPSDMVMLCWLAAWLVANFGAVVTAVESIRNLHEKILLPELRRRVERWSGVQTIGDLFSPTMVDLFKVRLSHAAAAVCASPPKRFPPASMCLLQLSAC